jgi:hypothetical protein
MIEAKQIPRFWLRATLQFAVVIILACIWFYFRTVAYLSGPPDGDLYAWTWGFQIMCFMVIWLPLILLINSLALCFQYFLFKKRYIVQSDSSADS